MKKFLAWFIGIAVTLAIAGYVAFQVSPWPAALLIRMAFEKDAADVSKALEEHVPSGVSARLNEGFDLADGGALLDVFYPSAIEKTDRALPTIVWVHGGGWVSGTKNHIANYAKILAHRGYTVVGVDYLIAPRGTYPTPVRQVNTALAYLAKNARRLHVDPAQFFLAGDSAGAQIAAQLANAVNVPSYASALGIVPSIQGSQLRGLLLYCGAYDTKQLNLEGPFGDFLKTVLWSYSGGKDFQTDPRFATASVIDYVTADFPPVFISAGNADPLLAQSGAFAGKLIDLGVRVDSLFFPADRTPGLPHEYQFNLDTYAGRLALERSVTFLAKLRMEP